MGCHLSARTVKMMHTAETDFRYHCYCLSKALVSISTAESPSASHSKYSCLARNEAHISWQHRVGDKQDPVQIQV